METHQLQHTEQKTNRNASPQALPFLSFLFLFSKDIASSCLYVNIKQWNQCRGLVVCVST